MPNHARPSFLRLLHGTDRGAHDDRHDRPKTNAPPEIPPGVMATPDEIAAFNYLLQVGFRAGVHGREDSIAFFNAARLYVRACKFDKLCETPGLLTNNGGKIKISSWVAQSRLHWADLRLALQELAMSPIGRARLGAAGMFQPEKPQDDWASIGVPRKSWQKKGEGGDDGAGSTGASA